MLKAVGTCRQALLSGVTTARDVGSKGGINIQIAQAVAAGRLLGPRISAAGEWLAFAGVWGPFCRTCTNLSDLSDAIIEQIERGAALIKIGVAGTGPDGEQTAPMEQDIIAGAVALAHSAGLKLAAHGIGFEGTRRAVEAGVDSVEHGFFLDENTARLMGQQGTYLVPTMSAWDAHLRIGKEQDLPRAELKHWEEFQENSRRGFHLALQHGVPIAAGSDAGGGWVRHGMLVREIQLMIDEGMTPMQALQSATIVAADLLGVTDQVGSVEVGKFADLVLLDGDPLSDPASLFRVAAVFKGGTRVR